MDNDLKKLSTLLMKTLFMITFLVSLALNAQKTRVQKEKDHVVNIISPDELHAHFSEYIIIDAREENFKQGHIPKSFSMDWKDLTKTRPGLLHYLTGSVASWGKVTTSKAQIESLLSSMNIANSSQVVVVGDGVAHGLAVHCRQARVEHPGTSRCR